MSDTAAEAPPRSSRWDANASFWVQIIRERRDKYRNELTDPAMLQAIGDPEGLDVLDAGCGEGYLSRILARQGATVTGIDFSANLIEAARAESLNDILSVSFDVGTVDDLPYEDEAFDLVVCNHLMNDLRDPGKAIAQFSHVLRSGGRLIVLMLHPCFYNRHAERDQTTNGLLASSYFDVRSIEQAFEVDGLSSPAANTAWFRPLEYYAQELSRAGFAITNLVEPHPSPERLKADPWWAQSFTRPLFMILENKLLRSNSAI